MAIPTTTIDTATVTIDRRSPGLAVMFYCLVHFEEREPRDRFGTEYEAYCARVPLFIPKLRT